MIKISKLSYSVPTKDLFNKVSFEIEDDAHYALIGTNGAGKSTLFNLILNKEDFLYDGKVECCDEFVKSRIGYVSQFSQKDKRTDQTVFEYISEEFVALDQKIAELCEKMATETDLDQIFEEYQIALDEKEAIDGDHYDVNIKKQLKLANLEKLENQKLDNLSGGEFKLIQVIKELLLSPKIIFMDEPDVFLDFAHISALVELINHHKGTIMVITHNRYLLNHCFNRILHLENGDIQEFEGSYIEYRLEILATKVDLQEAAIKDEEEIARQQGIVTKLRNKATAFDNASFGRSVHARQTMLDRLENRKTKMPFLELREPEIFFAMAEPVEEENILSLKDYEAAFDEQLLKGINFDIKPTDKLAIVGKNGTGKTTLLTDIWNQKKDSIMISEQAKMAMFSQVIDSNQFEKEKLSGGEKDLRQLEVIGTQNTNLLLLDEPTGHLDIYAQISLEKAIKSYEGCVIMVSHDFYTIANCVDYVLWVEDQQIRKMSIRRFRQMIYEKHFNKDYLLLEDKKKELELRIEQFLQKKEYEKAKDLLGQLEENIKLMKTT